MAGDWIKIEHGLLDKPEVMQICDELNLSPYEAVGHLVAVWVWVDLNLSPICPQVQGTRKGLDRVAGRDGFTTAMEKVGWLTFKDGLISIPNYDSHLSNSAKQRAKEAKKKAKQRKTSVPDLSPPVGDNSGTKQGTREEKRKEESIKKNTVKRPKIEVDRPDFIEEQTWLDWKAARKGAVITVSVMRGIQKQADLAGISIAEAIAFAASKSWRSFEADWYFKIVGKQQSNYKEL